MTNRLLVTLAVALILATAGCAGLSPDAWDDSGGAEAEPEGTTATPRSAGVADADDGSAGAGSFEPPALRTPGTFDNYTALYDATENSVVEIRVQTAQGQGQGSGFVYHPDGYVVTNQHVVSDAGTVSVGFASGV